MLIRKIGTISGITVQKVEEFRLLLTWKLFLCSFEVASKIFFPLPKLNAKREVVCCGFFFFFVVVIFLKVDVF